MPTSRFSQAFVSFALLIALYWCYAGIVVPWIEPEPQERVAITMQEPHESPTPRFQEILEPLFAADSWERRDDVKIIKDKNHELIFLVRKYWTREDGRLQIQPCTVVQLPQQTGERTWIIQAAEGAVLEFDRPFDVHGTAGGKLKAGFLPGTVIISGSPSGPGLEDRVEIETSDVQFNERSISTIQDVHLRYGKSFASGRNLTIRLAHLQSGEIRRLPSPAPAQIRQVELVHLLQAVVFPPSGKKLNNQPVLPIQAKCDGPVILDPVAGLAKMMDNVVVSHERESGLPNSIHCDALVAHLTHQPPPLAPVTSNDRKLDLAIPPMRLERIVATGQPVTLAAVTSAVGSATDASSGNANRWHQIQATQLEYVFMDDEFIGQMQAGGPGRYQTGPFQPGDTNPDERHESVEMELKWHERLEVHPHDTGLELALTGQALCNVRSFGSIQSETLWVQFVAAATASTATPASGREPSQTKYRSLRPAAVIAEQEVRITAEQLQAETQRLDVVLHDRSANPPRARGSLRGESHNGLGSSSPRDEDLDNETAGRQFRIRGDRMQIDVGYAKKQHEVEEVFLEGHVYCSELLVDANATPMEMQGQSFRLSRLSRTGGLAVIKGEPALIRAKQLNVAGGEIVLDRDQNQLQIEGRGSATVPLPAELAERHPTRPAVADVSWEGGLVFDGRTIRCSDRVLVQGPAQRLRANTMTASLSAAIDFGSSEFDSSQISVTTIQADGDVDVESQTSDEAGWLSIDRGHVQRIEIDNRNQEVMATGPGWIETVRRDDAIRQSSSPNTLPFQKGQSGTRGLVFLHVDFQQGFDAGVQRKQITFRDRVRAIYGPVSDWNDRLQVQPDGHLQPSTAHLGCDALTVYQLPGRTTERSFEMLAEGNTMVEGRADTGQLYAARGYRLAYDQAKGSIVLEGNGRANAKLWHQKQPGGSRDIMSAQKIRYNVLTNAHQAIGGDMVDINIDGG